MQPHSLSERFLANERFSAAVSAAMIVVMMICAATVATQVAQWLAPPWQGGYLVVGAALVALEAVVSARLANRFGLSAWNWVVYRLTELIVILAAIKLFLYTHTGWDRLLADLPRWQKDWYTFFDGEYVFACLLLGAVWLLSWMLAGTLIEMEGDIILLERETLIESNRGVARRRLAGQIFGIGAGLVALTALLRSDLGFIGIHASALQASVFNVVVYFVLGLLLFSLGHFAVLRATWSLERIEIGRNIASRWATYSVAMLLGVGLLVSLLPTRYSLGLLGTLGYLLSVLLTGLYGVAALMLGAWFLLLAWLSQLLGLSAKSMPTAGPQPPRLMLPLPALPAGGPIPWVEAVKSILFWMVFLGVLGYSLYAYLGRRKDVAIFLRRFPLWRWLVEGWRSAWNRAQAFNQQVAAAVQKGLRRLRPLNAGQPGRYVSLRRLSPAERVRFFYLALVRRGGESGWPRRASQTPYEYENDLNASLPEADDDVAALTEAFMEARYSQHPISMQAADAIRRRWEKLRQVLRPRRTKP